MQGFPMLFFINLEQATLYSGQDIRAVSPSNRSAGLINSPFWGCLELPAFRVAKPVSQKFVPAACIQAAEMRGHHRRCRTPSASMIRLPECAECAPTLPSSRSKTYYVQSERH